MPPRSIIRDTASAFEQSGVRVRVRKVFKVRVRIRRILNVRVRVELSFCSFGCSFTEYIHAASACGVCVCVCVREREREG